MSPTGASAGSVDVRRARSEDRPAVLALLAATFGAGGLIDDPSFWEWKHELSPFGPSPRLVAEANGRIVALRAFLPWRFRAGGREVRAVRAVDTATDPAWRGRGLFRRLTLRLADELATEGVAFVFNTPNRQSLPGYLSMGWRDASRIPVWIRILRPLRLAGALARPGESSDEGAPLPREPDQDVERLLGEPGLSLLLDADDMGAASDHRYHTVRTEEYLRWRYADVPRLIYAARWHLDGRAAGGNAAIIFRRKLRRGLRELMVAEVLTDGDAGAQQAAILLRDSMNEMGADVATALAARGTPEAAALSRAGFSRLPAFGPHLVVRPLGTGAGAADPADRRNWRPALGDLELF